MMFLYLATIGFAILLFLLMGVFLYNVSCGLNQKDAIEIDPLPPESTEEESNVIKS
ncbi:hypothetical protein [Sutcliffiella rhizosphaerae]|uniref:Uncharacterized protein n=1 Tax=Sutcliffiella rhizosphaerae TaxID=2880967 RepID=A0ABM8YSF1_9BACI|nr:hypothetical protein [Sutcliffiella rhizosphaerae]CAG9622926.1 hypothetical protein BACCIP111883_03721 [Sutcliffiella rhizosphaerae]